MRDGIVEDLLAEMAKANHLARYAFRNRVVSYEVQLVKLDDDDHGGLSVVIADAKTGRPIGYMHPDDFRRMWDAVGQEALARGIGRALP